MNFNELNACHINSPDSDFDSVDFSPATRKVEMDKRSSQLLDENEEKKETELVLLANPEPSRPVIQLDFSRTKKD